MKDLVIDTDLFFPTKNELLELLKKLETKQELTIDEEFALFKIRLISKIIKFKKTRI